MSLITMRKKFKKAEKPIQWMLVVVFGVTSVAFFSGYRGGPSVQAQSDVMAKVNNQEIPRELYQRYYQFNQQRMRMSNPMGAAGPEVEIQMRAAAYDMAEKELLRVQVAKEQGLQVSDRDASAEQKKLVDQILSTKLGNLPADEKSEFEAKVREAYPLELVRNQMMGQALQKKLESQTKPTDADLMKSFQEYKTRHILIKSDSRPDAEARRRADDVLAKVKAGVGFDDLARKYSEDPGSKSKGGDLGWVSEKTGFVPEFKAALLTLGKGQMSPLVKTSFGYHIIKVDDVRTSVPKDFNKPGKKAEYMKQYTDQLVQDKFNALMDTAQKSAKIEPVDPFVQGYLAENAMLEAQQKGNQPLAAQKLQESIAGYEKSASGPDGGTAIYAKLAQLCQQAKQEDKAMAYLERSMGGHIDPQMAFQLGELQMKHKKNLEALAAFQKASEAATDMPWLRPQLAQRFRDLKRTDLASKEDAKWKEWQQKNMKGGTANVKVGNQTMQLSHESTPVSPEELKKLKKQQPAKAAPATK
jgi:parvulin-like peptidyl-prolyl isomerase